MNQDQVNGYIRTGCTAVGSILIARGFVTAEQVTVLTTGLTGVAGLVFLGLSLYGTYKSNSTKAKIASVAANSDVAKITMKPTNAGIEIAQAVPSDKVTT